MKYLISQRYRHPEFGVIHIVVRANARRFIAAWKNDELVVTVPERTTVEAFQKALEAMAPQLRTRKPESRFFGVGWTLDTPTFHFSVVAGTDDMYHRDVDFDAGVVTFRMAASTPPEGSLRFNQFVNAGLEDYA